MVITFKTGAIPLFKMKFRVNIHWVSCKTRSTKLWQEMLYSVAVTFLLLTHNTKKLNEVFLEPNMLLCYWLIFAKLVTSLAHGGLITGGFLNNTYYTDCGQWLYHHGDKAVWLLVILQALLLYHHETKTINDKICLFILFLIVNQYITCMLCAMQWLHVTEWTMRKQPALRSLHAVAKSF